MAIYTEFFSPDPLSEPYEIAAMMTSPSIEVEDFVGEKLMNIHKNSTFTNLTCGDHKSSRLNLFIFAC